MGHLVIATYRPKPGCEAALADLVREHVPILRRLGLATERTPIAMRAPDGTLLEVFEWTSAEAVARAHHDPEVGELWARFAAVCDCVPLGELPCASELFPHFEPLDG